MDSGFGSADRAIPEQVIALAGGCPLTAVWHNSVGGATWVYGEGGARRFVKWSPAGGVDLGEEVVRLEWAGQYARVPVVVDAGSGSDGSWMITLPLNGDNAVAERWLASPAVATRAIGEGLRALHEALPVPSCPFTWSAPERVADAERRAEAGRIDPGNWHESHRPISLTAALAIARDVPDIDQLVVCHGDTCAPNTLIDDSGHWSGHVDFASMGVADRWADLAIATWSTEWNYGPGREQSVLDAYGIDAELERTRYYRLLWELDP